MKFIQIINQKKFVLLNIIFFLYIILNMLDGDRGLISYFEKNNEKRILINQKEILSNKLTSTEYKISLLSENLDLDYLETLYRKKFMVGKKKENIYKIIK